MVLGILSLAALTLASSTPSLPASVGLQVLGARLERDSNVLRTGRAASLAYLSPDLPGGRLFVGLANVGHERLTIRSLSVDGHAFAAWTDPSLDKGRVSSQNWWEADPGTVTPGSTLSIRVRMADLSVLAPGPHHVMTLDTNGGKVSVRFDIAASAVWIPSVAFEPSMEGAVLFVGNQGGHAVRLDLNNGVRVNGSVVKAKAPRSVIEPGGVVPVTVHLGAELQQGSWVLLQVASNVGTAIGSVRAFPAGFGVSFWQVGYQPGLADASKAGVNVSVDVPGATPVVDEPFGHGKTPMDVVNMVRKRRSDSPTQPTMIQLTGVDSVLLYSDIADITMTHHNRLEQDLSLRLSWPKPVWYLPQIAWGEAEGVGAERHWPPLSDLRRQAFEAVANGAKGIQWFTFWNLWEQGFGRGGALDLTRKHLDLSMLGAVGNPLLMQQVGLVSAVLRTAAPILASSAPYGRRREGPLEATTLVHDAGQAVAVIVDHSRPQTLSGGLAAGSIAPARFDVPVRVDVPPYLKVSVGYEIDPERGVLTIPLRSSSGAGVTMRLPVLDSAAVVVLGDAKVGIELREAWKAATKALGAPLRSVLTRQAPAVGTGWSEAGAIERASVPIVNGSATSVARVLVNVPWPSSQVVDPASVRVRWGTGSRSVAVPFRMQAPVVYSDFASSGSAVLETKDWLHASRGAGGTTLEWTDQPGPWQHDVIGLQPPTGNGDWSSDGWIAGTRTHFSILAKGLEDAYAPDLQKVLIEVDLNGDGTPDAGLGAALVRQPSIQHADGTRSYVFDVAALYRSTYGRPWPDSARWRPRFQFEAPPSSEPRTSRIELVRLTLGLGRALSADIPALAPGNEGTLRVYFSPEGWGPDESAPLRETGPVPDLPARSGGGLEAAGATLTSNGTKLVIHTPVRVSKVRLDVYRSNGTFVTGIEAEAGHGAAGGSVATVDVGAFAPSDTLVVSLVGGQGLGFSFAYSYDRSCRCGVTVGHEALDSANLGATPSWARHYAAGTHVTAVAGAADGHVFAVATRARGSGAADGAWRGRIDLLAEDGTASTSLTVADGTAFGTVFGVALSPDGSRLYLAANLSPTSGVDYADVQILAFRLGHGGVPPRLLWRTRSGAPFPETGRAVQTFKAAPVGGIIYSDWYGHVVSLRADGSVRWAADAGAYVEGLRPLPDGGALAATALDLVRIRPSGAIDALLKRSPGSTFRAVAGTVASAAAVDSAVHVVDLNGNGLVGTAWVGWGPRVAQGLGDGAGGSSFIVGTSDGSVALVSPAAKLEWTVTAPSSIVGDIQGLDGTLFAVSEQFDYSILRGWRFRCVLRGFSISGRQVYAATCPWKPQSSIPRLVGFGRAHVVVADGGDVFGFRLDGVGDSLP